MQCRSPQPKRIGPYAPDERRAGRYKQRRRTHTRFRYGPHPLDGVEEYERERQEDVPSEKISAKDVRQAGDHSSGVRRGHHQHERANECRHHEDTQQPPPPQTERRPQAEGDVPGGTDDRERE